MFCIFTKPKPKVAERVGFEPTHAVTRLADFESAPWASWVPFRSKTDYNMLAKGNQYPYPVCM